MIYQDAYGTVREIKKYGCYLTCYVNACSIQTGKKFNQLDLNEIYYKAYDNEIIEADCYINNALDFCRQTLKWDIRDVKKVGKDYECVGDEIEIDLFRRFDPRSDEASEDGYVYHFVLRGRHNVLYDPIEKGSKTAREGMLHTKRIIKLKEPSKVF